MTKIKPSKTGIILVVNNFDECVAFYRGLFGLKVLHEKIQGDFRLTCLEFGDGYLTIETDPSAPATAAEKTINQNPTKLRFNVRDIDAALKTLLDLGIEAKIEKYEWGSTINLVDPDGNRVGIRDELGFEADSKLFLAVRRK